MRHRATVGICGGGVKPTVWKRCGHPRLHGQAQSMRHCYGATVTVTHRRVQHPVWKRAHISYLAAVCISLGGHVLIFAPGRVAASPRKRFPARKLGLVDCIEGLAGSSRHLYRTELGRCRMIGRSGYAARYGYGSAVTVPQDLSLTSVYSFNTFRKSSPPQNHQRIVSIVSISNSKQ